MKKIVALSVFNYLSGVMVRRQLAACAGQTAAILSIMVSTAAAAERVPSPVVPSAVQKSGAVSKPSAPASDAQNGTRQISTQQAMYQFLIAEIAGQRGRSELAAQGMLDLAIRLRDPRVARRAAEIAFQARQTAEAKIALLLWLELEPESQLARQALGALLGTNGPLAKVFETMAQWLGGENAETKYAAVLFAQMPYLLARYPDRLKIAMAVAEFALPFQHMAEAQFAVGVTAMMAGNRDAASAGLDRALVLRPGFSRAAIAKAQLIRGGTENGQAVGASDGDAAAANFLAGFLRDQPAATDVRIAHARLLVGMRALLEAREGFRRAAREIPADPELPYAIGLISLQIEDLAEAETQFVRTLGLQPRDKNPVYFNLAAVADGKKDIEAALNWYRQISGGDYFVGAQLKIANLLVKRDGFEAGRRFLRDAQKAQEVDADLPDTATQLVLAEVQLLRESGGSKGFTEAYQVLTTALEKKPESTELRYDRAMLAEKLDRLEAMEEDIRTVIKIKPDHAHAYNALGYTLAERGIRLDEAYQLIQKALSIAPGDAFIQDSLGWVQFKLGRLEDALATLERAYAIRRDPEIAAHLGEVMWRLGKRSEAIALWQSAIKESPGNPGLTAVMERLAR